MRRINMNNFEGAIERIKMLECPTGQLEQRVTDILEEYGVSKRDDIKIKREIALDSESAQGYSARLNNGDQSIRFLASSGLDDYVAKVVEVKLQ